MELISTYRKFISAGRTMDTIQLPCTYHQVGLFGVAVTLRSGLTWSMVDAMRHQELIWALYTHVHQELIGPDFGAPTFPVHLRAVKALVPNSHGDKPDVICATRAVVAHLRAPSSLRRHQCRVRVSRSRSICFERRPLGRAAEPGGQGCHSCPRWPARYISGAGHS